MRSEERRQRCGMSRGVGKMSTEKESREPVALLYLTWFSWGGSRAAASIGDEVLGRFSVCSFVHPFVHLSVHPEAWLAGPEAWLTGPEAWLARPGWLGLRPGWLGLRPGWLGLRYGWLGLGPGWLGQRPGWLSLRPGWLSLRPGWLGLRPRSSLGLVGQFWRRSPAKLLIV